MPKATKKSQTQKTNTKKIVAKKSAAKRTGSPKQSNPPQFAARSTSLPASSTTQWRIGEPAPDFTLPNDAGQIVSLADYRGRKVVLYFYPEDDTPGCTTEACSFRDGLRSLHQRRAVVLGVSADSVKSHVKFKQKLHLNFPLLSDVDKIVCNAYGVWREKQMFGRKYMGIVRTTFIIDEQGTIIKVFPQVKVESHFDEVLAAL